MVAKLGYHDPRPFWVSYDVQAFACESEFGNPSGHCSMSLGMALTAAFDYWENGDKTWWKRLIVFLLAISFGLSIAFTRLFLGVHSLD